MSFDPLATALSALSRFAGSSVAERFGLRKPAENLAYHATRLGFRAVNQTVRSFRAAGKLLRPLRPARPERHSQLFDPTPTDDQRMLQDAVRHFAGEILRPAAAAADEACEVPSSILDAANELGIGTMAVPEALGGAGGERSPVASVLAAEELGRGDMGMAVAILAPLGVANALSLWGTAEQQERYLPPFLEESAFPAAIALMEPTPLLDPGRLATRAVRRGEGFVLDGVKSLVPLAGRAELFLVAATIDGEGPALFAVESATHGLAVTPEPAMGLRAAALGRLELRDVCLPSSARLGADRLPYEELVDLARLAWCALAVGTAQAVLDYVIPYVNGRIAFGEPISNRQSVAFLVANLAIELESMRALTRHAASRAEQGLPFHREVSLARVLCAEKAMEIGTGGVQLLGGHGFVKEHPVERWYRDLRAAGLMEGGLLA